MVPLAIRPNPPLHIDFNEYYVLEHEFRRFADQEVWRDAIFAHVTQKHERLMMRLWKCVEANREGRIAPSMDDLVKRNDPVEPPPPPPTPTPVWLLWSHVPAWAILLWICLSLVLRLRRVR